VDSDPISVGELLFDKLEVTVGHDGPGVDLVEVGNISHASRKFHISMGHVYGALAHIEGNINQFRHQAIKIDEPEVVAIMIADNFKLPEARESAPQIGEISTEGGGIRHVGEVVAVPAEKVSIPRRVKPHRL
jgi:hypothetical protein